MPLLVSPIDGSPMRQIHRYGIELDVCPTSGGVWLDKGELEKILLILQEDLEAAAAQRVRPAEPQPQVQPQQQPQQPAYEQPRYRERDDDDRRDSRQYRDRDDDDRRYHERKYDDKYYKDDKYRGKPYKKDKMSRVFDIFDF